MSDHLDEDDDGGEIEASEAVDTGTVCPECGKDCHTKLTLGAHRKRIHGVEGVKRQPSGKRRGRPPGSKNRTSSERVSGGGSSRQSGRRTKVKQTLTEFVNFTDELHGVGTSQPERLADVIRRDADRIADSVAWVAEKLSPLGQLIDATMGHGGIITIARGFMGVGTWLLASGRRRREAAATEREAAVAEQEGFAAPDPDVAPERWAQL